MKYTKYPAKTLICLLFLGVMACFSCQNVLEIDDTDGSLGETNAPVSAEVKLSKPLIIAAEDGLKLKISDLLNLRKTLYFRVRLNLVQLL